MIQLHVTPGKDAISLGILRPKYRLKYSAGNIPEYSEKEGRNDVEVAPSLTPGTRFLMPLQFAASL